MTKVQYHNLRVVTSTDRPTKATPRQRLLSALQAAYATMPGADQADCADMFLAMITAGVQEGGRCQEDDGECVI